MLIPKDCVKGPVASNYCMFAIDVEATHWDLACEVHGHLQGISRCGDEQKGCRYGGVASITQICTCVLENFKSFHEGH